MKRVILLCLFLLSCVRARADEAATSHAFIMACHDKPSLIAFLARMPKGADLHMHVSGEIYSERILDRAISAGMFFDPSTTSFYDTDGPGRVPAQSLARDGNNLNRFLDAVSVRGVRGGVSGHDHFFQTFGVFNSVFDHISNEDMLTWIVTDAQEQHVQYLEVNDTPEAIVELRKHAPETVDDPAATLAKLGPALETFVQAARQELDRADVEVPRRLHWRGRLSDGTCPVTVRYMVQCNRNSPDAQFFATAAAGMCLMQADPRVVCVNMAGPEDGVVARTHFAAQMRLLDFLWRHFGHPNLSLHAGELTPMYAPPEALRTHIRQTIEIGHARRIGHGVTIAWDPDPGELLARMRREGIAVEICLTSNEAILGVQLRDHPVHLYRRAGVPFTINTDDAGVNRSNLTLEYVKLVQALHPRYAELKDIVRNSLEYAFLRGQSLYVGHDYRRLKADFAAVRRPRWTPSARARRALQASEKLRQEVQLERALVRFEERN